MGKAFYIDSENVGMTWLKLDLHFSDDDKIYIFSNRQTPKPPQPFLNNSNVKFVNITVDTKGHNDLDILIAGCIGASLPLYDSFVIISNDTGYNALTAYFKDKYNCSIEIMKIPDAFTRITKIKHHIKAMNIEKEKKSHLMMLLDKYRYDKRGKQKLYNKLCKSYGQAEGQKLYSEIKKYISA